MDFTNIFLTWGHFVSFFKHTNKSSLTLKYTIKTDFRNCIIFIFKLLTLITQPYIIKKLIKVSMKYF